MTSCQVQWRHWMRIVMLCLSTKFCDNRSRGKGISTNFQFCVICQLSMTSFYARWRHWMPIVMSLPSTTFCDNRSRGQGDMGLLPDCRVLFAAADDVIESPMTSLDVYCHVDPFHKVWWESVQGLRRYMPTSSLVLFAVVDDVILCPITSLSAHCHVVEFYKVFW